VKSYQVYAFRITMTRLEIFGGQVFSLGKSETELAKSLSTREGDTDLPHHLNSWISIFQNKFLRIRVSRATISDSLDRLSGLVEM